MAEEPEITPAQRAAAEAILVAHDRATRARFIADGTIVPGEWTAGTRQFVVVAEAPQHDARVFGRPKKAA